MKMLLGGLLTLSGIALADTISTPAANTIVAMPTAGSYAASTLIGNIPFFNNNSVDGTQLNAGYFVTNTGGFAGGSQFAADGYLGQVANNNAAALNFGLVRNATSVNVTVLYQNAPQTNPNQGAIPSGLAFGIYDVDTNAKTQIYAAGTIPSQVGVSTVVDTSSIGSIYGFYATVCQPGFGLGDCYTFYSDTGLNPAVTNSFQSFVVEGPGNVHQHFALFTINGNAEAYYLAFENSITSTGYDGIAGPEKYGDFNDVIFQIGVATPEPATLSMMGFGLLGLGLMGRRLQKR
jgi:hypothetical protein